MVACEDCKYIQELEYSHNCLHPSCFVKASGCNPLKGTTTRIVRTRNFIDKNVNCLCPDFEKLTLWQRLRRCN
jgi:hypothetical protein